MDDVHPAGALPDFNIFGWPYTGLVTLFALGVYFYFALRVGRARRMFKIAPPTMEGPPEFSRTMRVHANTTEQLLLFLPLLWIAALSSRDEIAAIIGAFWPIGRLMYGFGYYQDAEKRYPGLIINLMVVALLFALSGFELVRSILVWQK